MVILSIKHSAVPLYLRNGELYSALLVSRDVVTVPSDCFKISTELNKLEDVHFLLSTLAFWKVSVPPPSLVYYCAKHFAERDKILAVFSEFESQLPFLQFLDDLMDYLCFSPATETYSFAALSAIDFLWSNNEQENAIKICGLQINKQRGVVWNAQTTAFAAQCNQPQTLAFLHQLGCPWEVSTCTAAAQAGSVECLRYAYEHGCPWSEETLTTAVIGAHEACIHYAIINKCPGVANVCVAFAGNVESLRAARAAGCSLSPECYERATSSLASVRYLHEQGVTWHKNTCTWAAKLGNIEVLRYVHEHGAPWYYETAHTCAEKGRLECLMYAVQNGCPTTSWCSLWYLCSAAARTGQLDCLVYLHENGLPWSSTTCYYAAKCGSLPCLRYLHENGCPWSGQTAEAAAECNSLECLRYAHEHGCPWDYRVLDALCDSGETTAWECLDYAKAHNCPSVPQFGGMLLFIIVIVILFLFSLKYSKVA